MILVRTALKDYRKVRRVHGGTVNANSAGPGQGSRFTVSLPLSGRAQTPPA